MGLPGTLKYDDKNMPYIDLGSVAIRMEREDPPDWAIEIARKELRETPEIKEKAMQELRQLLHKEQNEKQLKMQVDDEHLLMFLRPCHFYPESAFKRIQNFFLMKYKYGNICENIVPSAITHLFEENLFSLFPTRDQHGRRILLIEGGKKWKPSKVPLADLFRAVQLSVLGAMVEPVSQICGAIVIIDMEDLPISHVMQFTPSFAAMLLDYVQEVICMRLKAVHIVNNSYIFNMIFAIFKPFIREKLRNRIFFHGKNMKSLAAHIDKNLLPAKYGGDASWELPPGKLLGEFFQKYSSDFEEVATYGYPEGYKFKK